MLYLGHCKWHRSTSTFRSCASSRRLSEDHFHSSRVLWCERPRRFHRRMRISSLPGNQQLTSIGLPLEKYSLSIIAFSLLYFLSICSKRSDVIIDWALSANGGKRDDGERISLFLQNATIEEKYGARRRTCIISLFSPRTRARFLSRSKDERKGRRKETREAGEQRIVFCLLTLSCRLLSFFFLLIRIQSLLLRLIFSPWLRDVLQMDVSRRKYIRRELTVCLSVSLLTIVGQSVLDGNTVWQSISLLSSVVRRLL